MDAFPLRSLCHLLFNSGSNIKLLRVFEPPWLTSSHPGMHSNNDHEHRVVTRSNSDFLGRRMLFDNALPIDFLQILVRAPERTR